MPRTSPTAFKFKSCFDSYWRPLTRGQLAQLLKRVYRCDRHNLVRLYYRGSHRFRILNGFEWMAIAPA